MMIESVAYGTRISDICDIPNSIAKVWLDHLGEDERLKEREYVEIDQVAMIGSEFHNLVIYRSSTGYHLSINPEEE
jgi:hypothetical protein